MRTFIFTKNIKKGNKIVKTIVGMVQSNSYPSSMKIEGSDFYGCDCIEVTEHCHIELGAVAK